CTRADQDDPGSARARGARGRSPLLALLLSRPTIYAGSFPLLRGEESVPTAGQAPRAARVEGDVRAEVHADHDPGPVHERAGQVAALHFLPGGDPDDAERQHRCRHRPEPVVDQPVPWHRRRTFYHGNRPCVKAYPDQRYGSRAASYMPTIRSPGIPAISRSITTLCGSGVMSPAYIDGATRTFAATICLTAVCPSRPP